MRTLLSLIICFQICRAQHPTCPESKTDYLLRCNCSVPSDEFYNAKQYTTYFMTTASISCADYVIVWRENCRLEEPTAETCSKTDDFDQLVQIPTAIAYWNGYNTGDDTDAEAKTGRWAENGRVFVFSRPVDLTFELGTYIYDTGLGFTFSFTMAQEYGIVKQIVHLPGLDMEQECVAGNGVVNPMASYLNFFSSPAILVCEEPEYKDFSGYYDESMLSLPPPFSGTTFAPTSMKWVSFIMQRSDSSNEFWRTYGFKIKPLDTSPEWIRIGPSTYWRTENDVYILSGFIPHAKNDNMRLLETLSGSGLYTSPDDLTPYYWGANSQTPHVRLHWGTLQAVLMGGTPLGDKPMQTFLTGKILSKASPYVVGPDTGLASALFADGFIHTAAVGGVMYDDEVVTMIASTPTVSGGAHWGVTELKTFAFLADSP